MNIIWTFMPWPGSQAQTCANNMKMPRRNMKLMWRLYCFHIYFISLSYCCLRSGARGPHKSGTKYWNDVEQMWKQCGFGLSHVLHIYFMCYSYHFHIWALGRQGTGANLHIIFTLWVLYDFHIYVCSWPGDHCHAQSLQCNQRQSSQSSYCICLLVSQTQSSWRPRTPLWRFAWPVHLSTGPVIGLSTPYPFWAQAPSNIWRCTSFSLPISADQPSTLGAPPVLPKSPSWIQTNNT